MGELITRQQADALFLAIPVLGVVAAVVAFAVTRTRGGARPAVAAVGWGALPVLMGLLWPVYNAIADRLGLDTVRNLFAVLALFITVGAAGGAVWARLTADAEAGVAPGADGGDATV